MDGQNRMRAVKRMVLAVALLLTLAGCWSSREIEDLGLVIGTALDLNRENGDRLEVTNQYLTSQTENQPNRAISATHSYKNITMTADAVLPALRDMALELDKQAFGQHAKVVVIGEALAKTYDIHQLLDFFLREQEVRPSGIILIAKGKAKDTLETTDPNTIPAIHLVDMAGGIKRSAKVLKPMTLTKLDAKLHSGSSFMMQYVVKQGGVAAYSGAAVFDGKTHKLRGLLKEEEVIGLSWLTGQGKGGLLEGTDELTGKLIIYESWKIDSEIKPVLAGDQVSFQVNIRSEGRIAEHWVPNGKPFDNGFLKRAEVAAEKRATDLVQHALGKVQQEYGTDVIGFGKRLQIKYPRYWKQVKGEWDERFRRCPVEIRVDITVKEYGTVGSS